VFARSTSLAAIMSGRQPLLAEGQQRRPASLASSARSDVSAIDVNPWEGSPVTTAKCGCNTTLFLGISLVFTCIGLYMGILNNIVDGR